MATKELIQRIEVGSGSASSIDFVSIPQTYTDLQVVLSGRSSATGSISIENIITFNGNTSSYSARQLYGSGSSAGASSPTNRQAGLIPDGSATSSTFSNLAIYIPNYTGSTNKSYSVDSVTENNATTTYAGILAGLWSNTAAISAITMTPSGGNWVQYTSASLYGVKRGSDGVVNYPATGGTITTSGGYTIHTFTTSGTFTTAKQLEVECLVVAGGGAGGYQHGGGGGAGGLLSSSGTIITSGSVFPVTIGAGGSGSSNNSVRGALGSASTFSSITTSGGGGGGTRNSQVNGSSGGSGGGGGYFGTTPAPGVAGQGNSGGAGNGHGGGGGGAGASGTASDGTNAGPGGAGVYSSISGTSTAYAGGGGGGHQGTSTPIPGGIGGGGAGSGITSGGNGVAGTGGGGGGGFYGAGITAGNGGSGVVIIRYLT